MLEIGIGVFLKKSNKKQKNMENKTEKYVLRRQIKNKEYLRKYMKSQSNNVFKKIKKNNDLKSVEHSVVTKLIKDE